MKKVFFFAFALCFGLTIASCSGNKQQNAEEGENVENAEASEDEGVNAEAEAAVVAYEEYCKKYDELMKRDDAGEEIYDDLMALQETSWDISEQLLKTEKLRNADQKARVKAVEEVIDAWQKKKLGI